MSEQGYTIAETAYEIGYKNPQHFTAAFKKKYNYLPSKLKTD
ncbi:helix-turn-helix domain-containing protein [Formosa algae]